MKPPQLPLHEFPYMRVFFYLAIILFSAIYADDLLGKTIAMI